MALRVASLLIALFAVNFRIVNVQDRVPQPLSGYAIRVTYPGGKSSHFLISSRGLKGVGGFTLAPGDIIKPAEKDDDQVSMIRVIASSEGDAWRIKVSVVKG